MSSPYAHSLYVDRDVDQRMVEIALGWLGSTSSAQWLSLTSTPGRGNSWLLEHLQYVTLANELQFDGIERILIKGSSPDDSPNGLGPLSNELYRRYVESRMKPWRRLKRRIRNAGPGRLILFSLVLLACLCLGFLFAGLEQYAQTSNIQWTTEFRRWFGTFWYDFIPNNWQRFPLWLFTKSIAGLPLTILAAAFVALVYRARKKRASQADVRDSRDEDLEFFESTDGLASELIEICHRSRGVLLLIDDAHNLQDNEKQLLIDLVSPKEGTRLQRFTMGHRVLIVTIESQSTSWEGRPLSITRDLEVPNFSLVELRDMARSQLIGEADEDIKGELESFLEQAQHNVNVLFEHREKKLVEQLGRLFSSIESRGFEDRFGLAEMMAYWAIRQERSVPKKDLVAWAESDELAGHLAAFGMRRPSEPEKLVNDLIDSATLVSHTDKRSCYFDVRRCRALQQWLLQKSEDGRELLARSHYFWFLSFSNRIAARIDPKEAEKLPSDYKQYLKYGVWHAVRLGIILESAPMILTRASGLTDSERAERSASVTASMLTAAVLYCSQGNLMEANNLIEDALEWLPGAAHPDAGKWLASAADQLWLNYWLCANPNIRQRIDELATEFSGLNEEPFWRVYQRFEETLQGKDKLSPPLDEPFTSEPHLVNIDHLTRTLWDIRQRHGLMNVALGDPAVSILEPIEGPGNSMAEFELRQIQAAAFNQRAATELLTQSLDRWRKRLVETKPMTGYLGSELLHTYHRARYWHTLAEVCRLARPKESQDADEVLEEELFSRVRAAFLTPVQDDCPLPDQVLQQAQSAYERAAQIAALLNWRPLIMEVNFQLGALLHTHTPVEHRRIESAWWQRWDELFGRSLEIERELQWVVNAPRIHLIRWKFFEDLAHEHSLEDAYNAFQAAKRAHYPSELILDWHWQVSALLTNFGDSETDRQRDAELHEGWANDLADLPEAAKHWRFDCLEYEKSHALLFAAQARRLLRQLDQAERLLNQANAFIEQASAKSADVPEKPQQVRDLMTSLNMQRAWLLEAQQRTDDYRRAIRELWRNIRSEDEDCAILLSSLVGIEYEEKVLDDPWPPKSGEAPQIDPENNGLSLPAEWFKGESFVRFKNRFEFRLYQLLNLVNFSERLPTSVPLPSLLFSTNPQSLFTTNALQIVAAFHWFGMNKFGETAISFARRGLQYGLNAQTTALVINLLEAVRYYFAEIEPVDREELETLQVLMRYEPNSDAYRLAYVGVLNESRHLLKHEQLALESREGPNWIAIADRLNDYLGVLVDATLLSNWVSAGVERSGLSQDDFLTSQDRRRKALREAKAKLDVENHTYCQGLLQPVLPTEPTPWVFLEDLRVLDLWLRCANLQGRNGNPNDEINKRASQLRKFTLQYIRQFELVIKEKEAQRIATDILNAIQDR